ncbi:MAG TPA: hypothetical protein VI111_09235 [Thermoleophilaceae bacterium]
MAPEDDGLAVHYLTLKPGTPVYDSTDTQIGTLVEVLDLPREQIMDGIVVKTSDGKRHFVDAPEVARTAERAVTLTITGAEVDQLPPPKSEPPLGASLNKLFSGFRRR